MPKFEGPAVAAWVDDSRFGFPSSFDIRISSFHPSFHPFMPNWRANRNPTFLWQGALIVLPVVILAGIGLHSLRQDRSLVEQEARERAQQIADLLAERIEAALTNTPIPKAAYSPAEIPAIGAESGPASFKVSVQNELLYPPAVRLLIPHLFDSAILGEAQARLWDAARSAEFAASDPKLAINLYRRFIADGPSPDLAAVACFNLGLLLANEKQYREASGQFALAIEKYPEAVLESGLPLRTLAEMKLIEMANGSPGPAVQLAFSSLDTVCSNAVFNPTPLTQRLLDQAAQLDKAADSHAGQWRMLWERHERARQLYAVARRMAAEPGRSLATVTGIMDDPQFQSALGRPGDSTNGPASPVATAASPPRLFWIQVAEPWLAVTLAPDPSGMWIVCRPEHDLQRTVSQQINDCRNLPDYFGVNVELAGRHFLAPTNLVLSAKGSSAPGNGQIRVGTVVYRSTAPVLAVSRAGPIYADQFKVRLLLTNPATLYARQRARTLSFGLLIAAATCVAMAGLVTARSAFRRQQRLAEMKTNFVSSVSHELRAPIASVRLMAESLDRGKIPEGEKRAGYYRLIVQECRRLTALIENVLDFSRIDQGRKQYEFEPTDLVALVQQTVSLMEPCATEHQVTLSVDVDEQLAALKPQPELDGRAIQQALVNLLDNAIKHSPAGQCVVVGLELFPTSEPAAIHLFVQDRGGGIPADEHGKIFEPFYRRGTELRRETQGIGIGLTIVKHVVEGHGGCVRVQSEVGQGSRFTIELPLNQIRNPNLQ
jgi:signal transduction histidine kinase/tetratricopeptide (TPR) repeat protein